MLLDLYACFVIENKEKLPTRTLLEFLAGRADRPWRELARGYAIDDRWLANQLRPYGIKPRNLRIGDSVVKGYIGEHFVEQARRYASKLDLEALRGDGQE